MNKSIADIAAELVADIDDLRQHWQRIPYLNVSRLSTYARQIIRLLPDAADQRALTVHGRELRGMITRLQGAYMACYGVRRLPSWLRRHRDGARQTDAAAFADCLAGFRRDTQLHAWLARHGDLSFDSFQGAYRSWRVLERRLARQDPRLQLVVRELLPFVRHARALVDIQQGALR